MVAARVWKDEDGTVVVTSVGRGWLIVPGAVWDAFAAAVKRGDVRPTGP